MDIDLNGGGIQFEKDDICNDMGDKLDDLKRSLNRTIDGARSFANKGITDAIPAPGDTVPPIDLTAVTDELDGLTGGMDAMKDKIGAAEPIPGSGVDVATIAECLGGFDLSKFSLPNLPDGTLDTSFIGKILEEAAAWVEDKLKDAIALLLDPTEQLLSNAIDSLKGLLDIKALDKLLQLAQCLQDCPGASFDSPVDIEAQLNKVGLKVTGEIDWDSEVFSDVTIDDTLKEKMDKVSEIKDGIADKLSKAKEFSPIPDPPQIPEIPKLENPINNIDIAGKIKSLF